MKTVLETYPFLLEIPPSMLSEIDLDTLHIPAPNERQLIGDLSANLNKNVVIYKKGHESKGLHLCRVLQPASLTHEQLQTLNFAENILSPDQVVVAYEKPLRLAQHSAIKLNQYI